MLDARNHQGKFGQDYIRVLASAAGLLVCEWDLDRDGIDLGFRLPDGVGRQASPTIEAQIKSWSAPAGSRGELNFRGLDEVQFNRLAGDDYAVPRYLFLVHVPADPGAYVDFTSDGALLRHLGYYLSLRSEPRIAAPSTKRRRTVRVPIGNVLTVRALLDLVRENRRPA